MKTKQKNIEIKLDKVVTLIARFGDYGNPDAMFFHLMDGRYGFEWSPTKNSITKLITTLQKVEGMMTDNTNKV